MDETLETQTKCPASVRRAAFRLNGVIRFAWKNRNAGRFGFWFIEFPVVIEFIAIPTAMLLHYRHDPRRTLGGKETVV